MNNESLAARFERLEALDEIRQLASKYAVSVDQRNLDALALLFAVDIRVGRDKQGRQAVKAYFDRALRQFRSSVHLVGNHIIEFDGPDAAHGLVYCRCEHEVGDKWVPMMLHYIDRYVRVDGRWYFAEVRRLQKLYAHDHLERPQGPNMLRWPGTEPAAGDWHAPYPSWEQFWREPGAAAPVPAEPVGGFIDRMLGR